MLQLEDFSCLTVRHKNAAFTPCTNMGDGPLWTQVLQRATVMPALGDTESALRRQRALVF